MSALRILYVDDDPDIRTIVAMALGLDGGIAMESVGSGAAAIALVESGFAPDVALLDVMMPEMTGSELLALMRAAAPTARVPVIFITARARPADIARYRTEGVIGVIRKPFDPVTLPSQIRALVDAAHATGRRDLLRHGDHKH